MPRENIHVLGIDSSLTATGLARIDMEIARDEEGLGSIRRAWSHCTATVGAPKPTADKSKRAMVRRVNALIFKIEGAFADDGNENLDLIAIESLAYSGTVKGESTWVLPWIWGRCLELAERYDVPLIEVATSTRAKYLTNNGRAGKDEVLAAAIKLWPEADIRNNNEADAMVVCAIGCHYLGHPIVVETQYRAEVLQKVST